MAEQTERCRACASLACDGRIGRTESVRRIGLVSKRKDEKGYWILVMRLVIIRCILVFGFWLSADVRLPRQVRQRPAIWQFQIRTKSFCAPAFSGQAASQSRGLEARGSKSSNINTYVLLHYCCIRNVASECSRSPNCTPYSKRCNVHN